MVPIVLAQHRKEPPLYTDSVRNASRFVNLGNFPLFFFGSSIVRRAGSDVGRKRPLGVFSLHPYAAPTSNLNNFATTEQPNRSNQM